jgi:hypothetical protein
LAAGIIEVARPMTSAFAADAFSRIQRSQIALLLFVHVDFPPS